MSDWTFLTLFLLGFLGGTHCVGMCGGLSSAFAMQLPAHLNRVSLIFLLNMGRLSGYVLVGGLLGALSQTALWFEHGVQLQFVLFFAANVLLFLMGLYLSGLFSAAAKIESLGKPLWRRINPLLNRLLPLKSMKACFFAGILWGWFPCGLVYNASLYVLGSGSAWQGMAVMLSFGLGTLPNLLAVGLFAVQLQNIVQNRWVRLIAGLLVCAWALWQIWILVGNR